MSTIRILVGDCRERLKDLPDKCFDVVFTSPPFYGCRAIAPPEQIGMEPTFDHHMGRLLEVFLDCYRVLCCQGSLWIHYGDCFAGDVGIMAPTARTAGDTRQPIGPEPIDCRDHDELMGFPWRLALFLKMARFRLKNALLLAMPTYGSTHEFLFEFTEARRIPRGSHLMNDSSSLSRTSIDVVRYALREYRVEPIRNVLDPFGGTGTTAIVAAEIGADCTLIELHREQAELAARRIRRECPGAVIESELEKSVV